MQTHCAVLGWVLASSAVGQAATPAASCAGSPDSTAPCLPRWHPEWSLARSTAIQPLGGGTTGGTAGTYFTPDLPWGLVSIDWSVASDVWYGGNTTAGRRASTCEATSIEGCRQLKRAKKAVRCFIYHNMELALEWLESQRAVMYDPQKQDWFVQYTDGRGNKNGTVYSTDIVWGDQYYWDYRVPAVADYVVSSVLASVSHPDVDGTFIDDIGFGGEHPNLLNDTRLTELEAAAINNATLITYQRLKTALVKAGKFDWQGLGNGDFAGPGIRRNASIPESPGMRDYWNMGCLDFMQKYCSKSNQHLPMLQGLVDMTPVNISVAAFLITRGPIAFIGSGVFSPPMEPHATDDIFRRLDVGAPTSLCKEGPPGVFSRSWSKGSASLDCNAWRSTLDFPTLGRTQGDEHEIRDRQTSSI